MRRIIMVLQTKVKRVQRPHVLKNISYHKNNWASQLKDAIIDRWSWISIIAKIKIVVISKLKDHTPAMVAIQKRNNHQTA